MYCSRCGTPNQPGDRFCSSCGAGLGSTETSAQGPSPRERIGRLVGTTRKARLVSAGTAAALTVAVVGFVVLKPTKDEIPRDAYTIAADRICLEAKRRIVAVEQSSVRGSDPGGFAQALVPAVGTWRSQFGRLVVPTDRTEEARQLAAALLEAEIGIAKLARSEARGDKRAVLAAAKRADEATSRVEEAVSSLGLDECASATIGISPNPS